MRISRSRIPWSRVRWYSSQRLWTSSTFGTPGEYVVGAGIPQSAQHLPRQRPIQSASAAAAKTITQTCATAAAHAAPANASARRGRARRVRDAGTEPPSSVRRYRQYNAPEPRGVAQLVEHRSPKPRAGGSSPSTPAPRFEATFQRSCRTNVLQVARLAGRAPENDRWRAADRPSICCLTGDLTRRAPR